MLAVVRFVVSVLARMFLSLRYRIHIHGLDQIRGLKGPVLILPNHPAYTDPAIVLTTLWPWLHPRPMLYEGNFHGILRPLMVLLNAVRVPDLDQASAHARTRAQQAVAGVIEGLRKGENHILWPSGRVEPNGVERLGGARAASDILEAVPQATVILVRTQGLWGSRFSYARTGHRPDMAANVRAGIGWLWANLLLFMPRRHIHLTLRRVERSELPEPRRETLNPWLEEWYNAEGRKPPLFVPYHFCLGARTFEYPPLPSDAELDLSKITTETKTEIAHLVADKLGRPLTAQEEQADTTLDQLGLDSLDRMELALRVEQRFGFSSDVVPANLGQMWALAQGLIEKRPPKPPPPEWFQESSDAGPLEIKGDTIAEAFVARALSHPQDVVVADDLAGVLTYERFLVGALVLARRFAALPAPNVGLLLPASVACDTAFIGLHLAGKLPVVLNWTTGPSNLIHAAQTMKLSHIITSRAFADRLGIAVEGVPFVYLETLRKEFSKWELLRTLLTVRYLPGSIRRHLPRVTSDQPAVVLFTSGSEKAPKAVPLTHSNLLTDMRYGIPVLGLTRKDSILGFLPAFHSFGMSVTGLLPLLSGLRVVHHPDPTDAAGLVQKIADYKPTLLAGTPTFVSYIYNRADAEQLASLRLIFVGAEKCPPSVWERVAKLTPQACLLEGYGITECSPVVAVNRPDANRPGTLGLPLPGVEVKLFDLDTDAPLPPNKMGMLLVSGPTVFPGYIGHDGPSPFRERDGKRWYVTGDLAEIDADGFIHFCGRLKRFLKAGGEMISLPALEEPFVKMFPPTEDGPRVAVEGVEFENGRRIVLFCTEPITLRDANARLLEAGFRGVMRLDEVRQVEKIPTLGTGKTDYKPLRALISSPEPQRA